MYEVWLWSGEVGICGCQVYVWKVCMYWYVSGDTGWLSAHVYVYVEPMSVHAEVREDVSRLPLLLSILGDRVCH